MYKYRSYISGVLAVIYKTLFEKKFFEKAKPGLPGAADSPYGGKGEDQFILDVTGPTDTEGVSDRARRALFGRCGNCG